MKFSMQFSGSAIVGRLSLINSVKRPKAPRFPFMRNSCLKLAATGANPSGQARRLCPGGGVSDVFAAHRLSEIFYPVVGRVAVDVVNFIFRPSAVAHGPYHSMGLKRFAENGSGFVTADGIIRAVKSGLPGKPDIPRGYSSALAIFRDGPFLPIKTACLWVANKDTV